MSLHDITYHTCSYMRKCRIWYPLTIYRLHTHTCFHCFSMYGHGKHVPGSSTYSGVPLWVVVVGKWSKGNGTCLRKLTQLRPALSRTGRRLTSTSQDWKIERVDPKIRSGECSRSGMLQTNKPGNRPRSTDIFRVQQQPQSLLKALQTLKQRI